jgi:hypothetical protein
MYRKVLNIGICLILFSAVSASQHVFAEPKLPTEYQVKAAFLYNFLKFVEWPEGRSPVSDAAIPLCILGNDPFGNIMDDFKDKQVAGKKVVISQIRSASGIRDCQALFISGSEKVDVEAIAELASGLQILTIGDTERFAQKGVIINMYMDNNKVRFEINIDASKKAGLRIDSRLLNLATIVRSK